MQKSEIHWTDMSWNVVRGCDIVSLGCRECYAMKTAHRFNGKGQTYEGLTEMGPNGPRWNGKVRLVPEKLNEPLRHKKPQNIFVNSMSDLFHKDVPFEFIDKVFAVMALCPQHTFQILTKRAERMREYMESRSKYAGYWKNAVPAGWSLAFKGISLVKFPLDNVWLGVSVENQATADERIPLLLQTPAKTRFVSYEPALSGITLRPEWLKPPKYPDARPDLKEQYREKWHELHPTISWLICGGESGPGARPFDVAWARSVIQQCKAAQVSCYVKQMGSKPQTRNDQVADVWYYADGSDMDTVEGPNHPELQYQGGTVTLKLKDRKGGDMSEWPHDLRVRDFPQ